MANPKTKPSTPSTHATLIERAVNRATRWCPYVWPTFILPLGVIYALDFLKLLLLFAQIVIICVMGGMTFGMVFGLWCGIMHKYRPDDVHATFTKMKLAEMVPTVKWGFDLAQWALEENNEDRT